LVNGEVVLEQGKANGERAGRVLLKTDAKKTGEGS
jgi:hypothetical protein